MLRVLLQGHQTAQVSRKMGYSFDQVRRWQSDSKELRWDEFCDLCEVLQVPLKESLKTVFLFDSRDSDELYFFLTHLRKNHLRWSLRELNEKIGVHPSVLKRFFNGQVFPSLDVVFKMIDLHKNLLSSFLFALVGIQTELPFDEWIQTGQVQVTTETTWPLASAIEGLLCIEEYKQQAVHDENWFVKRLGVSRQLFRQTWKYMLDAGLVTEQNSKYKITYTTINTQGATPLQVCKMAEFWTERARKRFLSRDHMPVNNGQNPNIVAYRIVPLSKESMKKATEIILKANQDILAVAEQEQGSFDDVRVFLFHHFSVGDFPLEPLETLQEVFSDELEPGRSISSLKS